MKTKDEQPEESRKPIMDAKGKRPHYLAHISYNEDFTATIALFEELIKGDPKFQRKIVDKKHNTTTLVTDNQAFSKAMRYLIKDYNNLRIAMKEANKFNKITTLYGTAFLPYWTTFRDMDNIDVPDLIKEYVDKHGGIKNEKKS